MEQLSVSNATVPVVAILKSLISNTALPPLLNTASEKVIALVVLPALILKFDVIVAIMFYNIYINK